MSADRLWQTIAARTSKLLCSLSSIESTWAPPPDLRQLRGRDLKIDGRVVTDVDAFAVDGTTLLLINAKSFLRLRECELGDYRMLINRRSDVLDAVDKWQRKVEDLRLHPKGNNYDFSAFPQIISVVCLSAPFFVPLGEATRIVHGSLRAACTYSELADELGIEIGISGLIGRVE